MARKNLLVQEKSEEVALNTDIKMVPINSEKVCLLISLKYSKSHLDTSTRTKYLVEST